MNKKIILAFLLMVTLVGCSNISKTEQQEESKPKEFEYIKDSSFVIGENMKAIKFSEVKDAKNIIDWYSDPFCPSCVKLEMLMKETNKELVKKGMLIKFSPLGFMSSKNVDDYSNRASAFILSVAEYSPDTAYHFMSRVMDESFLPSKDDYVDNKVFEELFLETGGTKAKWEQIQSTYQEVYDMVKVQTAVIYNDAEFLKKSSSGNLSVPFVIIGDSEFNLDFSQTDDPAKLFLDEVNKYMEKK